MKVFLEQNLLAEAKMKALPAQQLPFSTIPKALFAKTAVVHRQSRRNESSSLSAVRSDKQADQADSNTLQLIADITQ